MIRYMSLCFGALFIWGCYTQFATLNTGLNDSDPAETANETVKTQIDTIVTRDRETCVWERDLLGYPYLKCYKSFYSHDWFSYSSTPWWYRNYSHWYDYKRCPRYYYYDRSCGSCRYYKENPNYWHGGSNGSNGNSSSGGSSSGSSVIIRPRSDGIPSAGTRVQQPGSRQSNGELLKANPVVIEPVQNNSQDSKRTRSMGVPDAGTAVPANNQRNVQQGQVAPVPPIQKSGEMQRPQVETFRPDSSRSGDPRNSRRNARGW